jgi:hypothetical protein
MPSTPSSPTSYPYNRVSTSPLASSPIDKHTATRPAHHHSTPSPQLSEAILHPHASVQDKGGPLQPHPHVYGHGYVQAQSFGGPSEQSILAQINAAREAIGPANAELNQAIGALRRGAEGVYERYVLNRVLTVLWLPLAWSFLRASF